ncbi:hydrogen gas-evolving membrane-bound hydrogenase subunit E [Pontibacter populi]|uniref:Hydrogen gas-evolving membrane-bound hydrogenase subunit E n=1 Tax=Pontibacter populi TaxID=890055 RepID=A0ABV1RYM0_9BACT
MLYFLLGGFLYAFTVPVLHRFLGKYIFIPQVLLPLLLLLYYNTFLPGVLAGNTYSITHDWVPSLGVQLHFYIDGLALLFCFLITVFGALIMFYAAHYLHDHPKLGRFYLYLTLFMMAMLGVVTAGNLISLFIFWELTSISSYLLIGFGHEKEESRNAALQALLVTGLGGLALMAGFILLGAASGTYSIPDLINRSSLIVSDSLYLPLLLFILLGAFTKSAQFPFHFWLPNAMSAPTPVSAYLHSATMVKAGVYLLARLAPVLGGTDVWQYSLTITGTVTALLGAYLALQHSDLKAILAYTTISALGLLVSFIGIGTEEAIKAMVVFLLAHALYKGALFMVAGNLDHATGTRDYHHLQGLLKPMLFTAVAALLASLSMAGVLPFFGFIAKELLYEASSASSWLLLLFSFFTGVIFVAVAFITGYRIFWRNRNAPSQLLHPDSKALAFPPLLLGLISIAFGFMPGLLVSPLLNLSASAVLGHPSDFTLSLWHGFTPILGLSILTLLAGFIVYRYLESFGQLTSNFSVLYTYGPNKLYFLTIKGLQTGARYVTATIQNGYLRLYIASIIMSQVVLLVFAIWYNSPPLLLYEKLYLLQEVQLHEWLLVLLVFPVLVTVLKTRSRLTAIAVLGIMGYTVALVYILFGAPDIAATQLLIETLTVLIFVLVLHKLPAFRYLTHARQRITFVVISLLFGATMTYIVLLVKQFPLTSELKKYYGDNAYLLGKGKNIVNVILVDFRALDTLGEITVLAVAAIGIYALLKLRLEKGD